MDIQAAAVTALAGYALFLLLAFGLRTLVHLRRTGTTGFIGLRGRVGSAEWCGGMLFVIAVLAGGAAPALQLAGIVGPFGALNDPAVQALGISLYLLGAGGTLWAQFAMGESWRIGVDAAARTELVVAGPFRWVRNPIFTAMGVATLGLVCIVPNAVSVFTIVVLVIALEIQVRFVEEPYLLRTHGESYRRYRADTGRFLPGLGRRLGA